MEQLRPFCLLGVWMIYTHAISVVMLMVAVVAGVELLLIFSVNGD
jgi:hypothetical protein